ncbi:NAD-dependent epimerase/dehydratase family protein [Streptomyces sp. URMC 123]|uniref:NAD-dependent epimerase/dehydratase family protein n=1 Tax=Streptomyces sp. URMC 123 TaxID=3423403 RepID=UPI003F1BCDFE
MRVLVLGTSGFLGRHAVERLRAVPGVRVLVGGRRPTADLTVDLATATVPELTEALRELGPSAVVNCVGAVGGSAVRLAEVNVRGPAVLCEALRAAAPSARLVHLGSAAEYGPTPRGEPLTEAAPTRPVSAYGATKLAGTLAVTTAGLDAVVLRVFNPVGAGAPASGLPGRLAGELRRAGPAGTVRVGDLSAYRDFVDARDVGQAVALAATARAPLPRVLNIGSGVASRVRAIAEELVRASGFRGRIEESGAGSERSRAVSWQQADVSAAAAALGWYPDRSLPSSLADLWRSMADEEAGHGEGHGGDGGHGEHHGGSHGGGPGGVRTGSRGGARPEHSGPVRHPARGDR